jgi:DNA-3-methyladenine glycosylase I
MAGYCSVAIGHLVHGPFHDDEHGVRPEGEAGLFERLLLEINQAGLSWEIVLRKREGLRAGYRNYEIDRVAAFGEADRARLRADPGVIRNRLKIEAAIANARVIQGMRLEYGSFGGWLDAHHPRELPEWTRLFRGTFSFVGGEIVREFLEGTGYLPGAHSEECPRYPGWMATRPRWTEGSS